MRNDFEMDKLAAEIYEQSGKQRVFISPVYYGYLNGLIHQDSWDWLREKKLLNLPAEAQRDPVERSNIAAQNLRVLDSAPNLKDFIGMNEAAAQLKRIMAGITFRAAARNASLKLSTGFANILISGPAGVGKTSLAQCAAQMLKKYWSR